MSFAATRSLRLLVGYFLLSAILFPAIVFAQEAPSDPLQGQREVVESNELAFIWTDLDRPTVSQKLYDFVSFGNPAIEDSLQAQDRVDLSSEFPIAGTRTIDGVAGDFNGDGIDEIIAVWESTDRAVVAHHPTTGLDTSGDLPRLTWEQSSTYQFKPAGTLNEFERTERTLRLVAGEFDGDESQELLFGYIDAAGNLRLEVLEITGGQLQTQFDSQVLPMPVGAQATVERSLYFDVNTGDVDGDDIDEIIIGSVRQVTDSCTASQECWAATAYVFDVTGSSISLMGDVDLFEKLDNSSRWLRAIAVEPGDFDGDGSIEIAAALEETDNSSQSRWRLAGLTWNGSALVENFNEQVHQTTGNSGWPLSMVASDLDFDGNDEVVMAMRNLSIYDADSTFTFFSRVGGSNFSPDNSNSGRRMLAVADVDGASRMWYSTDDQGAHRPEIIVAETFTISDDGGISVDATSSIQVYRFTPSQFNLELISEKTRDQVSDNSSAWPLMLIAGNFGDRGIRVGPPQFYRQTDIVQPLVILNAPPLHFDAFEGTAFDISNCYGGAGCGFSATYTEQSSQTVEVTSEVRGDWQMGAGIEGGLNAILDEIPVAGEAVADLLDALGLGIDFNFEASYGEGFSELLGTQRTITLTTQVSTFDDDAIYANVVDYDIWEYPLYVRGQFAGNMAIVLPNPQRDQWFTSRTPEAAAYRPAHEFGNILSYPKDLNPNRQSQQVFTGSRYTLGSQTVLWDVTQEQTQFSQSSTSTRLQLGGELDISLPIPTMELNLNGDYSEETFNTHSTSVSNMEAVTVQFGQIEATVEGKKANYSVTPFVYWERSGALVVDYSVEPSIAGVGEVETWWQDRYGKLPDPAFNLPERHEDLKSGNTVDPATLTRTKSFAFFPQIAEPGQTVSIQALVHNYSLLPTATEVPVRFYAGDPAAGGTPITGSGGNPDPMLPVIEARGSATVSTTWQLPGSFNESAVRIYAVIDPNNTLTEIHESNNTGWAPLRTTNNIGTAIDVEELPGSFELHANYPNPFNPSTTLSFTLDQPQDVKLTVYDVLGRQVKVLVDELTPAGLHAIRFDAGSLGSGTYFYRLQTRDRAEVRSMVLMK